MRHVRLLILLALIVLCTGGAFIFGATGARLNKDWATSAADVTISLFLDRPGSARSGFRDTTDRVAVDCKSWPVDVGEREVWLVVGQSNAGNNASGERVVSQGAVNLNPFDGNCYIAVDPLLGADGNKASPWVIAANAYLSSRKETSVLLLVVPVNGSRVADWAPHGRLFVRLEDSLAMLQTKGLIANRIIWFQGESDAYRTSREDYGVALGEIVAYLRSASPQSEIFVSRTSLCLRGKDAAITAAQSDVIRRFEAVIAGPNTDDLDRLYDRRDGCHFSETGNAEVALRWAQVFLETVAE